MKILNKLPIISRVIEKKYKKKFILLRCNGIKGTKCLKISTIKIKLIGSKLQFWKKNGRNYKTRFALSKVIFSL